MQPVPQGIAPQQTYVVTLGEIGVTNYGTVVTPYGSCPLSGSNWAVSSSWNTWTYNPTWAVVMFFLTVWFLGLGIIFLFVRSTAVSGTAVVTVSGAGIHHSAYLPISSLSHPGYYQDVVNRLNADAARY